MSEDKPTLPEIKESLEGVLDFFGPQQLTDGMHEHLTWLLDLVTAIVEGDDE